MPQNCPPGQLVTFGPDGMPYCSPEAGGGAVTTPPSQPQGGTSPFDQNFQPMAPTIPDWGPQGRPGGDRAAPEDCVISADQGSCPAGYEPLGGAVDDEGNPLCAATDHKRCGYVIPPPPNPATGEIGPWGLPGYKFQGYEGDQPGAGVQAGTDQAGNPVDSYGNPLATDGQGNVLPPEMQAPGFAAPMQAPAPAGSPPQFAPEYGPDYGQAPEAFAAASATVSPGSYQADYYEEPYEDEDGESDAYSQMNGYTGDSDLAGAAAPPRLRAASKVTAPKRAVPTRGGRWLGNKKGQRAVYKRTKALKASQLKSLRQAGAAQQAKIAALTQTRAPGSGPRMVARSPQVTAVTSNYRPMVARPTARAAARLTAQRTQQQPYIKGDVMGGYVTDGYNRGMPYPVAGGCMGYESGRQVVRGYNRGLPYPQMVMGESGRQVVRGYNRGLPYPQMVMGAQPQGRWRWRMLPDGRWAPATQRPGGRWYAASGYEPPPVSPQRGPWRPVYGPTGRFGLGVSTCQRCPRGVQASYNYMAPYPRW